MVFQRKARRIAPVFLVTMLFLITALPALADPPEFSTYELSGDFVLAECDGFDVIDEYAGTVHRTQFYDKGGELIRMKNHVDVWDRIYNSVTGYEVWSRWANTTFHDIPSGGYTIAGVGWNVTVPGAGAVWFDAGHCVYDPVTDEETCTGNEQYDPEPVCEAMDR
jgi:hypothetical protein